jgi:hypothetical protein
MSNSSSSDMKKGEKVTSQSLKRLEERRDTTMRNLIRVHHRRRKPSNRRKTKDTERIHSNTKIKQNILVVKVVVLISRCIGR